MRAIFTTVLFSIFLFRFGWSQIENIDFYPPTPIPDRIILTLTDSSDTSMAVNWRTSLSVNKALVQVAKADPSPDFQKRSQMFEGETTAF